MPAMSSLKVLLVEDSADVQAALRTLLAMIPRVVVVGVAADAEAALRLVAGLQPDLVVLDVPFLGAERGLEVLRHLRQYHPKVDVIALSNLGWQALRDSYLEAGARAYFDKALQFEDACDWIRTRAAQA